MLIAPRRGGRLGAVPETEGIFVDIGNREWRSHVVPFICFWSATTWHVIRKIDRRRVLWKISALAENPRCAEARKLPEKEDSHRICLEHHRVVFQIDDLRKQVTVFRIAQRRRQSSTW